MVTICVKAMFLVAASIARPLTTSSPRAVEIAAGVQMPLMNLGGIEEALMPNKDSNYTMWLELGGRGIDTALIYGDAVQEEVGRVVNGAAVPREHIFVTTKIPCGEFRGRSTGDPAVDVAHTFDVLGLDYVDLFLLHWPCRESDTGKMDAAATMRAYRQLEALKLDGKARTIGVSNFNADDLDKLMTLARVPPAVNQAEFSIGNHDDRTLQKCRELNITYSAYSPLGGINGLDVLHNDEVLSVASAHGRSTAEVALRWVVQQGVVAVTASNKESHQKSDLSVFDFELTDAEMNSLSSVQVNTNKPSPRLVLPLALLLSGASLTFCACFMFQRKRRPRDSREELSCSLQTISAP